MRDLIKLCKSPSTLYAPLRSHDLKSDPRASEIPQSPEYSQHQAVAYFSPTLQSGSLQAPRYHQDDRSWDHPSQKYRVRSEHLASHSDGPTHGTLASECPQDSSSQVGENNTSGLQSFKFQELYSSPGQKARRYTGSPEPYWDDDLKDRLSARGPGQDIATAASSPRAVSMNPQPDGYDSPRAPRMHSIPLPERPEDQYLSYDGQALGCGLRLTGTLDGDPKVLSHLDTALPEPPFVSVLTFGKSNTAIASENAAGHEVKVGEATDIHGMLGRLLLDVVGIYDCRLCLMLTMLILPAALAQSCPCCAVLSL